MYFSRSLQVHQSVYALASQSFLNTCQDTTSPGVKVFHSMTSHSDIHFNGSDTDSGDLPRPARGFCVKAQLRKTPDKGIGVFAAEFIPAGTITSKVSKASRYFDESQARAYLASLPSVKEKRYWVAHVYQVKEKIAEDPLDLNMINHSNAPTTRLFITDYNDGYSHALRDIEEGDELTEDYRSYPEVPFLDRLMEEYGVTEDFLKDD